MSDQRIRITWALDDNVPLTGVRGVDYETVEVRNLVKWARRRQRRLKRDIRRGYDEMERQKAERDAAACEPGSMEGANDE